MTRQISTLEDLVEFTGVLMFKSPSCGPCAMLLPRLREFCTFHGIELAIADVPNAMNLVRHLGVRAAPTTMRIVSGRPRTILVGAATDGLDALL